MTEPLSVIIDDDTETIHVDPVTGTVITDQPDGSKVVQLDARRPKKDDDDDEGDKWFANLADEIGEAELGRIANDLYEQVSADDASRSQKLDDIARGIDLCGLKLEDPKSSPGDSSSGVEGMSTVTNPLLLENLLKGWANAQAELLPANGPVKIRDDGDESVAEDDLADRFEKDMNHWFTTTAREYYPDTSRMLLWDTYFGGAGIKKIYRCPMRRRPVSESVAIKDFIVSDATKDLRACSRITHQIEMRPSVMKRMIFIEAYRDIGLTQPSGNVTAVDQTIGAVQGVTPQKARPEDQPYTIWETQCELDLDDCIPAKSQFKGEGIPLPYCVTMDKDSRQILAIRRDWDEPAEDVIGTKNEDASRKAMYVKYPYVPGPGFYGTGLLNILGNCSSAMTAAWREALDAGMYASFPGGLIAKNGTRQNSSLFRVAPGQFDAVETGGMDIRQVVMGMPYRDVTPGLIQMMEKITDQSNRVGGVADLPAGEGVQNVPVGTMLAAIEQATKIMAAAHKGMHTAQAEELGLIVELFRNNPEDFWRSNKIAPRDYWNEERFAQAVSNVNLVPVSDPNVPSHIHRIAKALGLVQLSAMPQFAPRMDMDEVLKRVLIAMKEDPKGIIVAPPPMPQGSDIGEQAKMLTAQAKIREAGTKAQKTQLDAADQAANAQLKRDEIAGKQRVAETDLQKELVIHAYDRERAMAKQQADDRAQMHKETMEQHQADSDMRDAARQREHDMNLAAADQAKAMREESAARQQEHHDRTVDVAQYNLDRHKVMNPPKPAAAKPKAKK